VQITTAGASREIWFCAFDCAGTAGAGRESDDGFVAQHCIRLQQSAQSPMAGFTQIGEADAGAICTPNNNRTDKMAKNRFTNLGFTVGEEQADCKLYFPRA
jgi:hypothetical protein